MLPRATATLSRSALAATSAARALSSATMKSGGKSGGGAAALVSSAAAAAPLLSPAAAAAPLLSPASFFSSAPAAVRTAVRTAINTTPNLLRPGAAAAAATKTLASRALASGVATKSGLGGEPLTTVTPERRLSAIARLWARTRDMPELAVMYFGVLTGLSLLAYTMAELIFNQKRGEHVGILLNPDVRGDFERQLSSAAGSAGEAAKRRGAAPDTAGGPAGGRASLWYWLGHLMVDDKGANVSIPPFENRLVHSPFPDNKPAAAAGGEARAG